MLFSNIVGRRGKVHAFEPVPPTFDLLKKRYETEHIYSNVRLSRCIVCSEEGSELDIRVPGEDYGQASLTAHKSGSWAKDTDQKTYKCNTKALDCYVAEQNIQHVNFIKIDVEGAELLVLKGALATLSRYKPTMLLEFFEGWTRDFNYAAPELISLLKSVGYTYFYLDNLQALHEPISELAAKRHSVNVICAAGALG
jgi:FkbM family methyltransferase